MDEIGLRNWMTSQGRNRKVTSDVVSRLKKIEREFGRIDIHDEYKKDRCERLMKAFSKKGENTVMQSMRSAAFPVGTYQMLTYRYAIRQYVIFADSLSSGSVPEDS